MSAARRAEVHRELLRETVRHAYERAPAARRKMDAAGVRPEDIRELADLLEHMATDTPWDQGTTLADVHMATLKALTVHIEHHGRYVTHTALLGHPASPLTR